MSYEFDLFVLGAGSGGVRAARMAASYGARVGIAEEAELGGTCVNVGCVPKKLFVYASHFARDLVEAEAYGWKTSKSEFDWPTLLRNKDREIARLNRLYGSLLEKSGVRLAEGSARVVDRHTVAVGEMTFTSEHLLIATGGWPFRPSFPGAELALTSNEMFHLPELPERVLVLGGGYIAVEFAGILAGLGVRTGLVYRGELFLRGFDGDLRRALMEEMAKVVQLHFSAHVDRLERFPGGLRVFLSDGTTLEADAVLLATGREPRSRGFGLEEIGVELSDNGAIVVDELSRTTVDNVWAIGDVTDRLNLTPVAIHEAMCLARTLFRAEPTAPDHELVATAVFSQPALATVGLSEEAAKAEGYEVEVYRSTFRALKQTLVGESGERTLLKLVVDRPTGRVLGAHAMAAEAAEIIQMAAVALKMGATKADFDRTMPIHPTTAEEFVTLREPAAH